METSYIIRVAECEERGGPWCFLAESVEMACKANGGWSAAVSSAADSKADLVRCTCHSVRTGMREK